MTMAVTVTTEQFMSCLSQCRGNVMARSTGDYCTWEVQYSLQIRA